MADSLHLLLDLQERDLVVDQLHHRRATLPERAALTERQQALAALDASRGEVATRLADVERTQKRLEDEVASLEEKQSAENLRLYSGTITSPRELQSIQEEIDGFARRQRSIEDDLLEVMETAEPLLAEIATTDARREALVAEAASLVAAIAEGERVVDAELATVVADRDAIAKEIPDDMLATYERLRKQLGGIAVARLEGNQCKGCHVSLPSMEVDAIRHAAPDAVITHEECGRILVRI